MKVIEQECYIYNWLDLMGSTNLKLIEKIGRTCYNSQDKITENSYEDFIKKLIKSGHESVLEHFLITVSFITDIGVSRELIRHRICSFTEQSTRYCDYSNGISFIRPIQFKADSKEYKIWFNSCYEAEKTYKSLEVSPQWKRSVLPLSTATNLTVSANIREWRHILKLRTAKGAHPQMISLMNELLSKLKELLPIVFEDIGE